MNSTGNAVFSQVSQITPAGYRGTRQPSPPSRQTSPTSRTGRRHPGHSDVSALQTCLSDDTCPRPRHARKHEHAGSGGELRHLEHHSQRTHRRRGRATAMKITHRKSTLLRGAGGLAAAVGAASIAFGAFATSAAAGGNPNFEGILSAAAPTGFMSSPLAYDVSSGPVTVDFDVVVTNLTAVSQSVGLNFSADHILTYNGVDVSDGQPGQPGITFTGPSGTTQVAMPGTQSFTTTGVPIRSSTWTCSTTSTPAGTTSSTSGRRRAAALTARASATGRPSPPASSGCSGATAAARGAPRHRRPPRRAQADPSSRPPPIAPHRRLTAGCWPPAPPAPAPAEAATDSGSACSCSASARSW